MNLTNPYRIHHIWLCSLLIFSILVVSAHAQTRAVVDSTGPSIGPISLANEGDLYVCGSPKGDHICGAIEFLRIAHGTLADAHTTIEELYAWQFDGPAGRDLRGRSPQGEGRDAGALETGPSKSRND